MIPKLDFTRLRNGHQKEPECVDIQVEEYEEEDSITESEGDPIGNYSVYLGTQSVKGDMTGSSFEHS